jgi:hypothetical protein
MTQDIAASSGADPSVPTTADRLQDAFDEIAILNGRLDSKSELVQLAFEAITELYGRIERHEALS